MALTRLYETTESWERVEGDGVTLRRPQYGDFEEWARLRARSRAFLSPWEPSWAYDELTKPAFRRRVRRYQRDARDGAAAPFFVFREEDGALVGGCNLSCIRRGVVQSCSLGYWVGEPYRRRGYIRRAARAAIGFAFAVLELNRVEAACIPSNEPSRRLLESLGFKHEGVARSFLKINGAWRDHLLFALVRGDPFG